MSGQRWTGIRQTIEKGVGENRAGKSGGENFDLGGNNSEHFDCDMGGRTTLSLLLFLGAAVAAASAAAAAAAAKGKKLN